MRLDSNPIPMKERTSMAWLECGNIEVQDGAFVLVDKDGVRTHLPVGGLACIFLEPGTRITHGAVALAAEVGCLIQWVGEGGVRLYSAGQPGGARSDRLLYQAKLALDDELRIKVVRAMYRFRFQDDPPARRSIEQLRGIEGVRVRTMYKLLAQQYGVPWDKREYDPDKFDSAIGFLHTGKPLSFVYDIADLFKFETSVRIAFKVVAANRGNPERETRLYCRNSFRKHKLLERIIPTIEEILAAGGTALPAAHEEAMPIAIPNKEQTGDAGHRS